MRQRRTVGKPSGKYRKFCPVCQLFAWFGHPEPVESRTSRDRGGRLGRIRGAEMLRKSLVWKLVLPVPVALIAMMAVLLVLVPRQVARDAQETAIENALQTIAHFRSVRDYYNTAVIPKIRDSQGAL